MSKPKKYVIIIADGAADFPIKKLKNKTPFEYSNIPTIHKLTLNGKTGLLKTCYEELPLGSIVAILGIIGYNPLKYYPNGRASFEALSHNIHLGEKDIAFRCNLISTTNGKIKDFTSKNISEKDALNIINNLNLNVANVELYYSQNYRNILILRDVECNAKDIIASEPHMNIGKNFKNIMLKGKTKKAKKVVNKLNNMMFQSIKTIKDLNKKYHTTTDMIWLWSPSYAPNLPSFLKKNKLSGAIVAGINFMRGIAINANITTTKIKGTTGNIDTNLKNKLKYTKFFLQNKDLVILHINAPDEESHSKSPENKVKSIEMIDKEIVTPIYNYLEKKYHNKYRLAFLPDHYTSLKDGKHHANPVPFMIFGEGISSDKVQHFTEKEIKKNSDKIVNSYEFLDILKDE